MGITLAAIQQLPPSFAFKSCPSGPPVPDVWILIRRQGCLFSAVMRGWRSHFRSGSLIMVGGNIKGYSRVLTTATVMETSRGTSIFHCLESFPLARLFHHLILTHIQQRERPVRTMSNDQSSMEMNSRQTLLYPGGSDIQVKREGSIPGYPILPDRKRRDPLSHRPEWSRKDDAPPDPLSSHEESLRRDPFHGKKVGRFSIFEYRRHLAMVFQEPFFSIRPFSTMWPRA